MWLLASARFEWFEYDPGDGRVEAHLETENRFEMIHSNFYMGVVDVEDRGNTTKPDEFFYFPICLGILDDGSPVARGLLLESHGNKSG